MSGDLKFPKDFLWGTATSPTQVEGHVVNEWTDYVASDGGIAASRAITITATRRTWLDVAARRQRLPHGHRMVPSARKTLRAAKSKGVGALIHLLDCLKAANITPMVVLHHFSNPLWIVKNGGWLNPETIPAFVDYAAKLSAALKERVYLWNTFNEPDTYASLTYLLGGFSPFHKWKFCRIEKPSSTWPRRTRRQAASSEKINFPASRKSASPRTGLRSARSRSSRCGIICSRKFPITPSTVLCWMNFWEASGVKPRHFSA